MNKTNKFSRPNAVIAVAVALVVALAGYIIIATFASGLFAEIEAENGSIAGSAESVSDRTASQGSALQFGSAPVDDPGSRVFYEGFERGNLDQWSYQACPGGVTIVDSPTRKGNGAAKFTVSDEDTNSRCDDVPTNNPRAQIVSDGLFDNGDEYYIAHSVYFPSNFPDVEGWFQFAEMYGPPYGGSPSMGIGIRGGDRISFDRDESHGYDSIWASSPIQRNTWYDLVYHIKFSTDPSEGFVEIWLNGQKQTLSNGEQRVNYRTLRSGLNWNGTPNYFFLNQYREGGTGLGTVTLYHDEAAVGTTLESVMP